MKIAITGGIGSGKSTVAAILKEAGYPVASCDETYARLCEDAAFLRELKTLFPAAVEDEPLRLDRKALAAAVFSDEDARTRLNAFTHPRIMRAMFAETEGETIAFYEVPLLFESGLKGDFDRTIVVLRDRETRKRAAMARSGLSAEETEARMRAQTDYESADLSGCRILQNDGDLAALKEKTLRLAKELAGK